MLKKTIPLIIAFVSGLIMVLAFFAPEGENWLSVISQEFLIWATIIGGFSLLLGAVSIFRINWKAVSSKRSGWGYNLVTVFGVLLLAIPAIIPRSMGGNLFGRDPGSIYDWMFVNVSTPMAATMFALLAFYIASAAYRAFRARSAQATILLCTAALVMLWRVPMGEAFLRSIADPLPELINSYVMNGFNMAVQRGIIIGAALGAATMSLRILLGIERTYLGRN